MRRFSAHDKNFLSRGRNDHKVDKGTTLESSLPSWLLRALRDTVFEMTPQVFVLLFVISSGLRAQAKVDSLFSPSLNKTQRYTILLPADRTSQQRFPALLLLHGYGGDHSNWTSFTRLAEYVKDLPLIVVMPDGENSWYVNSPTQPERRFEDYIVYDLRRHLAQRYGADTTRMAIAGLSMGGFGATMLALKYPRLFRFAGSLSGALSFSRDLPDTTARAGRLIAASFRPLHANPKALREFRDKYDLFRLAKTTADSLPYLYFSIGAQDGFLEFLPAHRELTNILRLRGVAYEYHEVPGGHNWPFWDREVQPMLRKLMEVLNN
ncbi:MAG TPA: alpha/beta hydrolase family protein [Bacteroidota bacterium]|nr:alpha/beta hydrolase family protein [Bacteroidota bacterium]